MTLFHKKWRALIDAFFIVGVLSCFLTTTSGADLTLSENGATEYRILLPESPTPTQNSAACELQAFFKESTGAELPIVSPADLSGVSDAASLTSQKLFILGPSDMSRLALQSDAESKISYDGIIIKTTGNAIVLSGAPLRGALYSVYEFLETQLGCRWWTTKESTIPHHDKVVLKDDLDVFYAPKLIYRESFYRDPITGAPAGPFSARTKCNGASNPVPDELGGHHRFQYFVHSSYPLIPPEKYFLDHPDWFSEIDGVRKVGEGWNPSEFTKSLKPEQVCRGGQLCFSNDEMLAELVKNARESLRKNPSATFLSVSQNDWHGNCTCEKCRKIDEEEGSPAGSLLRGVNKVAEALEEEFPNLFVETLAYQYTRKPPKITRPRHNVVVRLCSIECSFAQPLDAEQNRSFCDDMVGWSKIADNLFVWDYTTDFAFYLLPFPNYRVVGPNVNFFVDHKVIGLFEEGDFQCQTGDFVQLRNWVLSKLLWDPSLDPVALQDEFVAGYYAPELVPIYHEYFDLLSDAVEKDNYYLTIYKDRTNGWLDMDTLNKVTVLLRKAQAIAEELEKSDPERYKGLVFKVRREQIPIDLVWLLEYSVAKMECKLSGAEFMGPKDPQKAALDFIAKLDENGVTLKREGESPEAFAQFKKDIANRFANYDGSEVATPEVCKDLPEFTWIDLQDSDLNKIRMSELTFLVEDPNASNKHAVMMPGTHFEWATSWSFTSMLKKLRPIGEEDPENPVFHVYAYVRCDASTDEGTAMTAGVYDEGLRQGVSTNTYTVEQIKGEKYSLIDIGTTPLSDRSYVWFAPPKRPGEVEAVYIDRVVITREK